MSMPVDSHNITSHTPQVWRGKDVHISLFASLIWMLVLFMSAFDAKAEANAQSSLGKQEVMAHSATIHFRQSQSDIDLNLDGNRERLDKLIRDLKAITDQDSTYILNLLRVTGSSSLEGSEQFNRQLSERRAQSLFKYISEHVSYPDSITEFEYLGRNWPGLYHLVATDRSVPYQGEVLALLRKAFTTDLSTAESNRLLQRLKTLRGGVPYAYMYRNIFPALRYSDIYVEYSKRIHQEIADLVNLTIDSDEASLRDSVPAENVVTEFVGIEEIPTDSLTIVTADTLALPSETKKPFYMDLRTNMLYDIAAVPNIGAEFYLGKNFSILGNWMYGWWDNNPRHRYWRIYGGEVDARWWFGRKAHEKPLTGHHIGLYGGALIFDFEWGGTGYMGGKPGATLWERCLVNAGIEYGYSLPVGRHFNIDFSLGIGYLGGHYSKYYPFDNDYYREKEYKLRFFGPTKAEISLVWLIGRGNVNKRKGGDI